MLESQDPATVQVRYAQARYARVVRVSGVVSVAGVLPYDTLGQLGETHVEDQARRAFRNLGVVLSVQGADLSSIAAMTFCLRDPDDYQRLAAIRSEFLAAPLPEVTVIGASELPDGAAIELHALATARDLAPI